MKKTVNECNPWLFEEVQKVNFEKKKRIKEDPHRYDLRMLKRMIILALAALFLFLTSDANAALIGSSCIKCRDECQRIWVCPYCGYRNWELSWDEPYSCGLCGKQKPE